MSTLWKWNTGVRASLQREYHKNETVQAVKGTRYQQPQYNRRVSWWFESRTDECAI